MATLTSNISNVSLTVSGTTTQSATISWSLPSVPAGSTINSCTLTGTATASMSKGSATIKVNGTTVSSGSNFTINLGTNNTTSSVTATAVGGNKNASGTVTFSNLVYTIDYTEPAVTYTVTFVDWDGTVLKTEEVGSGGSATAPEVSRYGYVLTGWSVDFTNVRSDITTVAQYEIANVLAIKENGNWNNIGKVFKKTSGVWVEQTNSEWNSIFNTSTKYKIGKPNPVAILYSDGVMIFQDSDIIDPSHGDVIGIYTGWDTNEYTSSGSLPWYSSRASINNIYINTITSPKYTTNLFLGCSNLTSVDLSVLDTSNVVSMESMFTSCTNLVSLNLNNFNTNNVVSMKSMFSYCSNLTSVNLSGFDTNNVTNMSKMFSYCYRLTSPDLSNFNTSNVTNMDEMFRDCHDLTMLNLSSFDTNNVTSMNRMFISCWSLVSLDLSNFDMSKVTGTASMFSECTKLQTIYVKDETAKTKIESSTNFPTTATVVIGKPN